jgi:hypothetical protein
VLTDDQLIAYLAGTLPADERARVEAELAGDPEALRRVLDQERLDTALKLLLNPAATREQVKASVLAGIRTPTHTVSAEEVMKRVLLETGKNALAYRPSKDEQGPGLLAALRGAFMEWLGTVPGRVVFATAALTLLFVLVQTWRPPAGKPVGNLAQNPAVTSTNSAPPVAVAVALPTARDPVLWPFAADSPWNTPIGSGAQFAAVAPGGLDLTTGIMVVSARLSHPSFRETPTDAPVELLVAGQPTPLAALRLPDAALAATAVSRQLHLIAADGFTLYEVFGAQRAAGRVLTANNIKRHDLRGSGVPPDFASANGSGLTPFAGSLTRAELNGPIRRVLGSVVPLEAVAAKADGTAHVWPAGWSPANNPALRAKLAPRGNVHLGSLLALPPSVDLATLGVGTNGPAFEIARALQDYGLYVKDAFDGEWFTEWHQLGSPHLIICGDFASPADLPPNLRAQLALVIRHLQVVVNNGPGNIGGGGQPRVKTSAPPFAPQP